LASGVKFKFTDPDSSVNIVPVSPSTMEEPSLCVTAPPDTDKMRTLLGVELSESVRVVGVKVIAEVVSSVTPLMVTLPPALGAWLAMMLTPIEDVTRLSAFASVRSSVKVTLILGEPEVGDV
jgi:hypothetical protein